MYISIAKFQDWWEPQCVLWVGRPVRQRNCRTENRGIRLCFFSLCALSQKDESERGDRWVAQDPFIPVLNLPKRWRGSRTKPSHSPEGGSTGPSDSHSCLGSPCQHFGSGDWTWTLKRDHTIYKQRIYEVHEMDTCSFCVLQVIKCLAF